MTGVCSAGNAELVRSLGATKVVDYTTHDFATSGETWDVILIDAGTGNLRSVQKALESLGANVLRTHDPSQVLQCVLVRSDNEAVVVNITDVDPLEYDLLFERFLNPERISMPDIDIDICQDGRGREQQQAQGGAGPDARGRQHRGDDQEQASEGARAHGQRS